MYKVGDVAEMTKFISEADIYEFAEITGDRNPLHTSKEFAAKTKFGEWIAHGMMTAGMISAVLGVKLPGPGTIYLTQTLKFLAPVKIGDEITARVEIVEVISERRLRLKTQCPGITQRMVQTAMRRACLAARLRTRNPHDLRHTYAAILLMAHISPAYVQKQLGHHSISMTVDIYGHWIPGEGRDRLDLALRPKGKPGTPLALVQGQE
jgi:3-hydroxybutyryl-CoA dehydratase